MRAAGFEPLAAYDGAIKPWHCKCLRCGRESTPTLNRVRSSGSRCRHCAHNAPVDPLKAEKILHDANLRPLVGYPGATKPWQCECKNCGSIVSPLFANIQKGQGGCRYCAGNAPVEPAEALVVMNNAGVDPLTPFPGASKPWSSKCRNCDRIITPIYSNIRRGQGGCKYCAHKAVEITQCIEAMQNSGLSPITDYPGTGAPWLSKCVRCGNIVSPRLQAVRHGRGCRYCAGQVVLPDDALALMRSAMLEPVGAYPGAQPVWPCRCMKCNREVSPRYCQIKAGQGGCKYCAGNAKYEESAAIEIMRNAGLEPLTPFKNSNTPWRSKCVACENTVSPMLMSVRSGARCRFCAHNGPVEPKLAEDLMRNAGLEPLEPFRSSSTRWPCICLKCGKTTYPTYSNVRAGKACKYCSAHGFDFAQPGLVYVMTHAVGAVKIGITGTETTNRRFPQHQKYGWKLFRQRLFLDGNDAWTVEQEILHQLRMERNLAPYMGPEDMPQGGWSETFDAELITPSQLWTLISETASSLAQDDRALVPTPTQ